MSVPSALTALVQLKRATLGWAHWHNTQRLHGYLDDIPPAEFEQALNADQADREQLVGIE